jgi:AcrR family transcriptional regulator
MPSPSCLDPAAQDRPRANGQASPIPRRERERATHRAEILAAALELFAERGFHNVSMHEIAQRAEFAVGTLYKFFSSKEDLYKALVLEKAEQMHRSLEEALSKQGEVVAILKEYLARRAQLFADNAAFLRLYVAETQGASFNFRVGLDRDVRKIYDQFLAQLASVLEGGVRAKVFRDLDPYYMAVSLEGLCNAFVFEWLQDPQRHPYAALVPVILDTFLNGVLVR